MRTVQDRNESYQGEKVMNEYVECNNCKYQYECERTYLGGCTDGEEWGED